jgi:hypothetical protein
MEMIIMIALLAGMGYVAYRVLNKENSDGRHPLDGATKAPYKLEPTITTKVDGIGHESVPVQPTISNVLDVNKDGKVDIEDAKEAVKKTTKKVKTVAATVSEKVKKPKKKKAV